jgi:ATP-dependent phosphofructokinase / diphosphate-dependent phosphofructokinase
MIVTLGTLLVLQGGGPTPVVNASLFGVIDEASKSGIFTRILGARFGVEGLLKSDFVKLSTISSADLQRIRTTPGASLGTTRYKPREDELTRIRQILCRENIRSVLVIGGNGSLQGAHAIAEAVKDADISVIGIPKTIDNDICCTDRCPGFGSAARYVAQSVRDLGMDVRTLPQPVSIFETMGRSIGWLAAATALARIDESHAPHLIYLPERVFDFDRFVADVDNVVRNRGWAVAVVSEGIRDARGAIYETAESSQRDALDRPLPGGVAAYLASIVTKRLKIRCRWETPGLCARSSALHVSSVDRADAEAVGRFAVRAAIQRQTGQMVSLLPITEHDQAARCELVSLAHVKGDRPFPTEWIGEDNISVAPAFVEYARRIVGPLVDYAIPLKDQR